MELKFDVIGNTGDFVGIGFNRTFMELKFIDYLTEHQKGEVLIAPLWN